MVRLKWFSCGKEIDKNMPDVGKNMELSSGFSIFQRTGMFQDISKIKNENRDKVIDQRLLLKHICYQLLF